MKRKKEAVAKVGDLKEGQMKGVTVGETNVLLSRFDGKLHAIAATCSHFGGPLDEGALSRKVVVCPWHNAAFDITSGHLKRPPAMNDLAAFEVGVEGENIFVALPEKPEESRCPSMVKKKMDRLKLL